jgi:hypothetical protein
MKTRRFTTAAILLAVAGFFALGVLVGKGLGPFPSVAIAAFGDQSQGSKVSLEWQEVATNITRTVHRAAVPGGWLVAQQNGLAFIPDPDHAWRGKAESEDRF